jgi:hypothetical protein
VIEQNKFAFTIGTRVRFSELGAIRSPKMASRIQIVTSGGSGNGVRVVFDGSRTINTIHRSYLELVIDLN